MAKKVIIYSDGSCIRNPGPGGWAALLQYDGFEKMLSGGELDTTNNRMELLAVIESLRIIKRPVPVEVYTDSKYVSDAFNQGWLEKWKNNGWRASSGMVKNQDLWKELDAIVNKLTEGVQFKWVKGHNGNHKNNRVDQEANRQARIRL